MKNNFKTIIIIISLVVVAFGTYKLIDKVVYQKKWEWQQQSSTNTEQANQSSEKVENTTEQNKEENNEQEDNKEKSEKKDVKELKKITISDEELVDILIDAKPFEDVSEISTEEMLTIVYNALNENKIEAYKNRGKDKAKVEYTEGEVNGIVNSIFGTKLKENKSLGTSFTYKNGIYTLEHSDRGESVPVAKNIENDVAAGTRYINYDLYMSTNGKEELKGSYAIGINNNGSKVVKCKKEM